MTDTQAEIEVVEALWKHARTLRHNKNPRLSIAAAQREIVLENELEALKRQDQVKATAAAGKGGVH